MTALTAAILVAATTHVAAEAENGSKPIATRDSDAPLISDRSLNALALDPTASPAGTMVSVEVHGVDLAAVRKAVAAAGGDVYGEVPGFFVEARIPSEVLDTVAADPRVLRVAPVTQSSSSKPGPHRSFQANSPLAATIEDTIQLAAWHDAGYKGEGQRIGILDIFGQTELEDAIAGGRLPAPSGVFCLDQGNTCSITQSGPAAHGVGVAEIVHRTAPDAQLFLATVNTTSDLAAAVQWFANQGVTVINRSETSEFDGPGDGTGPIGSIVDQAVADGMVWVAAAGNAGGNAAENRNGQNWLGTFNDVDANGFHEWENGSELMEFECGFLLGMRWDDWANGIPTDYDLHIFDTREAELPEKSGNRVQRTTADQPFEHIDNSCDFGGDLDYLAIERFEDREPDGDDEIQILGNFTPMEEWTNESSATGPGAESPNPGAVTVGATTGPTSLGLATYSSQGPTMDGRPNPDLLAPSCLPVPNFGNCFTGTSASAPVVSGVLAVLRGAGVLESAAGADALVPRITVDQGAAGVDNQYGNGSLFLRAPAFFGVLPVGELCRGEVPTIVGTDGDDVLTGTEGPDVILGRAGNDRIMGNGGADLICGNDGRDNIRGGAGGDIIDGGPGGDRLRGETGADTVYGGGGGDRIFGNVGADELRGEGGNDRISAGAGDDEVRGGAGRDRLAGSPGADTVNGGVGSDRCFGGNLDGPNDPGDRVSKCETGV